MNLDPLNSLPWAGGGAATPTAFPARKLHGEAEKHYLSAADQYPFVSSDAGANRTSGAGDCPLAETHSWDHDGYLRCAPHSSEPLRESDAISSMSASV